MKKDSKKRVMKMREEKKPEKPGKIGKFFSLISSLVCMSGNNVEESRKDEDAQLYMVLLDKCMENIEQNDKHLPDEDSGPHTCTLAICSAIKQILRILPPLFTRQIQDDIVRYSKDDNNFSVEFVKNIIQRIPNPRLFRQVITHMHKISQHSAHNKMTAHNLSACFMPTIVPDGFQSLQMLRTDFPALCNFFAFAITHAPTIYAPPPLVTPPPSSPRSLSSLLSSHPKICRSVFPESVSYTMVNAPSGPVIIPLYFP